MDCIACSSLFDSCCTIHVMITLCSRKAKPYIWYILCRFMYARLRSKWLKFVKNRPNKHKLGTESNFNAGVKTSVINKINTYKTFSIFKTSQCKLPSTSGNINHFHSYTSHNQQYTQTITFSYGLRFSQFIHSYSQLNHILPKMPAIMILIIKHCWL